MESVESLPPEGCGDVVRGLAADVSQCITTSEPGTGIFSNRGGGGSVQKGGEFCIVCLIFRQSHRGNARADCFHAVQRVGDHIVLPGDMPDVRLELRYKVEMVELTWAALVALLAKCVC